MSLSPPTTATLVARRISKSRGTSVILQDVDLVVGPQHRVGILGPNGVGKTTLLRIMAGLEVADAGQVSLAPRSANVGYLAQEADLGYRLPASALPAPLPVPGETLRAYLGRKTEVDGAEAALASAAAGLAAVPQPPEAETAYAVALDRYLALGGPDFEARIGGVLAELALPERLLSVPMTGLSGGQRAKADLAALLLSRFDVLLLDEPTNDLDFDGLERLEGFLESREGALVVVSHDRAFLERVVNSILEIDEATHAARLYSGGWNAYLEARATARRHAEEAYDSFVAERSRLQAREHEQQQWAVKGVSRAKKGPPDNDKAQRDFRINRTEKQASKVRITERALARLEVVAKPFEAWQLNLELLETRRSGDLVALLDSAVVQRGDWTLGPVDLEVRYGDRLALLGPNGSGKTTLIGALLGRLPLESGVQRLGRSVVVGEIGQERRRFSTEEQPLLTTFQQATGLAAGESRSLLAKFGLAADHVLRSAASLSPGERTRAELALLMALGTNCLVLDEPTNHLDLSAIEQLEKALDSWSGTLLLVTHDRRLLQSVRLSGRLSLADGKASTLPA